MQKNRPASELAVITRAKQLCSYVFTVTEKSPKRFRFSLVTRLQNLGLDVVEQLFRANETFVAPGDIDAAKARLKLQHRASTSLKMMLYVSEMAQEQGCLTMKQYEQIAGQGFEIGNMIGGWINSDKKRFGHMAQGAGCVCE